MSRRLSWVGLGRRGNQAALQPFRENFLTNFFLCRPSD